MSTASDGAPRHMPPEPDRHARAVVALLDQLTSGPEVDPELVRRARDLRDYLTRPDRAERPFLSVVLRTQGQRLEPLKDALLCLSGQSSQDFEVLLLVHDAGHDASTAVRRIVQRQPPSFRDRIRVQEVEGGSRARPLNVGVEMANGHYLAVYDDDDLLFGQWVEVFAREAAANDGRMIRAIVANESVESETWAGGAEGFRTLSWPKPEYPASFDQFSHLLVNSSPFMSWAFPRELFAVYGVRFDEELLVAEDWDVIVRGSLLCGVDDAGELTAIYRRWTGSESSYAQHSSADWAGSEERVVERLDRSVLLLSPGTARAARQVLANADILQAHRHLFRGNQLRQPFLLGWHMATPVVKVGVRVRDRLRRAMRR